MMPLLLLACAAAPPAGPVAQPLEPPVAVAVAEPSLRKGPNLIGICDASAGVFDQGSLTIGEDEHNELYGFSLQGALDHRIPLPMGPGEIDIEGAASRPDGVWWIGSHDRGKGDKAKPSRQHLLRIPAGANSADIDRTDLLSLLARSDFAPILASTQGQTSKHTAGFSIEALHGDPEGLWIGLRAPIIDGKAQLVHLADPGGAAHIDRVASVDLGGRGFRGMEGHDGALYVVAGPAATDGAFALFRLEGLDSPNPQARPIPIDLGTLRPEGLVSTPEGLLLLSDDGGVKRRGTSCKKQPETDRFARTAWVELAE